MRNGLPPRLQTHIHAFTTDPAPASQACILYVLHVGVIEQLGEAAQRLLLERLTAILSPPVQPGAAAAAAPAATPATTAAAAALPPAVAVVVLETVALLLEVVGEVSAEGAAALAAPLIAQLVGGSCQAVRVQAASSLAALAVAEPSGAAALLRGALEGLGAATEALQSAAGAGKGSSARPAGPGTPRGLGSPRLKPEMNAVHGWGQGAAALLAATGRLELGVPSHLTTDALQLAKKLVAGGEGEEGQVRGYGKVLGWVCVSCFKAP
jgi:hypothetical protein